MTTLAQRSFAGGEIAPTIYSRTDMVKYQTGLRTCRNFLVMRHGGVSSRPGTQFLGEVPQKTGNEDKRVRFIPFYYSDSGTTVNYFLECGEDILHVWKDDARVWDEDKSIEGITAASPMVMELGDVTNLADGDEMLISGITGMPQLEGREVIIRDLGVDGANKCRLYDMMDQTIDGSAYGAYVSGGNAYRAYSISKAVWTYQDSEIEHLQFQQHQNSLYIVHRGYYTRIITKNSSADDDWSCDIVLFGPTTASPTSLDSDGPAETYTTNEEKYVVTAISAGNYEESLASNEEKIGHPPTNGSRIFGVINGNYGHGGTTTSLPICIDADGETFQLSCAGDLTGRTFTFYGYSRDGAYMQHSQAGTDSTTVNVGYPGGRDEFWWLQSVYIDGSTGGINCSVGLTNKTTTYVCPLQAPSGVGYLDWNVSNGEYAEIEYDINSSASRQIGIYSPSVDQSSRTFTVYGTDRNGDAISEDVDGPTGGHTRFTVNKYKTVTEVEVDSSYSGEVQVGVYSTELHPTNLTWQHSGSPLEYNIYRAVNGVYGFVGTSTSKSFRDDGLDPDYASPPPTQGASLITANSRPGVITMAQQRLWLASTYNDNELIRASRTGTPTNFSIHRPLQSDDAIEFKIAGREYGQVHHLVSLGRLVVFTSTGEWVLDGDETGAITPLAIAATQHSYRGSSTIPPVVIGGNAIYVQAGQRILRDLSYQFSSDSYTGNDLTVFAAHLFDDRLVRAMAYQQTPHSVLWCVMDDGALLGLTYLPEHQIWGWHRHDTDNGLFDEVGTMRSGAEDTTYTIVRRTLEDGPGGAERTHRYVEKMSSRYQADVEDYICCDSALTFDGTSTDGFIALSGGPPWDHTKTLTCSQLNWRNFTSADVGNQIHLWDADDNMIRFNIITYIDPLHVSGKVTTTVPPGLQGAWAAKQSMAFDEFHGLWHLEGLDVAVFGDGNVESSPSNPDYSTITVTNGAITCSQHYAKIQVGLPLTCDFQTLDIDTPSGEALMGRKSMVGRVTLMVESSRGIWCGQAEPPTDDPLDGLVQAKIRQSEAYDEPVGMVTGTVEVLTESEWNLNGRVFVRQVDPVPLTILGVAPSVYLPNRGRTR
jgi:hypothetical protein